MTNPEECRVLINMLATTKEPRYRENEYFQSKINKFDSITKDMLQVYFQSYSNLFKDGARNFYNAAL